MKKYFENKITYNQISFCLTNKPKIDEREIHSYHEILLYLEGDVELFTISGRRSLKSPSLIIVPAEVYHFLKQKKTAEFTRLKISFDAGVLKDSPLCQIMSELKIIDSFNEEINFVCKKLIDALKTENKNSGFYAYSAFMMLISELDGHKIYDKTESRDIKNSFIHIIAEYISNNLSQRLDIKSLAELVHISPSGITHMFKKEFGIPIHKYIMQKRLVYAKRLVESGEQLSKIYPDAGFKDYSSFYKAYINYFGYAPSRDKGKNK